MQVVLNPKYENLREWVNSLPEHFDRLGEVIYEDRNCIRTMDTAGLRLCVKRFHAPRGLNKLIYTCLRRPKAQRAYENALRLLGMGIATPTPVAYLLQYKNGLLAESYLVTLESELKQTMYLFRDGVTQGREDLIAAFARFAARLHNAGIRHKDFSPGNILLDKDEQGWHFELVDLNRMHFGHVSLRGGCRNLCRLWGKNDFFEIVAETYAYERGINEQQCLRWIQQARRRFWRHHAHDHFVTDDTFSLGVIISTYNNPRYLEKVFWGLRCQDLRPTEIIIADDGSDDRTRKLIEHYSHELPLRHVWHEDKGFRKTTILNQAVEASTADYLVFMDQDLIPRKDFLRQHYLHARKGHFLSGGAIMIPRELSERLSEEDIRSQRAFRISWLKENGLPWNWKMSKLTSNSFFARLMDAITPTKASWNGGNASTWREYIVRVKGFDTRMRYGAEDREFGQRLENAGITGLQIRYRTPLLHLWHERPYRNPEDWERNLMIWQQTRKQNLTETQYGL